MECVFFCRIQSRKKFLSSSGDSTYVIVIVFIPCVLLTVNNKFQLVGFIFLSGLMHSTTAVTSSMYRRQQERFGLFFTWTNHGIKCFINNISQVFHRKKYRYHFNFHMFSIGLP